MVLLSKCLAPYYGPLSLKISFGIPNLANIFFKLLTTQVAVVCPSGAISNFKVGSVLNFWPASVGIHQVSGNHPL